jgi:hypothetical protein
VFCPARRCAPLFPAHAAAPRRARVAASPRRGPLAAPDWLCSGRQWPQPLLLPPPARGPYDWTPRAAAGAVAVEREAALSWIRIQVRCCCCSELRAVRAVPRAHAAATTNQTCAVCSVLAFSVYWHCQSALASSRLPCCCLAAAAADRCCCCHLACGVADGASRNEGLLQRSGGPATRLGSADPVIGPSRSVEERGGARAAAHPSRTVVADMIVTAMLYFVYYFVITMLY